MKIIRLLVLFCFLSPVSGLYSQNLLTISNDSLAVITAVLDYAEGFYSGDAVRMERAIHPDLNKVCPATMSPGNKVYLMYSTWSGLLELTRANAGALAEPRRRIRVDVLAMNDNVSCARLRSANFNDYLQLVKIDQQWKIVNVLWTWGEDSPNKKVLADYKGASEKKEIEKVIQGFIEGIYTSDVARVDSLLHPEFRRATIIKMPSTGKYMIQRDAGSSVVEATRAGLGAMEKDKWNFTVKMLDCMDGLAMAELKIPTGWSYFQLAKIDGQWKIINILRKPNR